MTVFHILHPYHMYLNCFIPIARALCMYSPTGSKINIKTNCNPHNTLIAYLLFNCYFSLYYCNIVLNNFSHFITKYTLSNYLKIVIDHWYILSLHLFIFHYTSYSTHSVEKLFDDWVFSVYFKIIKING